MPQVQYYYPKENLRITKGMPSPKQYTRPVAWFRKARKFIPEIPDVFAATHWRIDYEDISAEWLRFDLRNADGERAYVVILTKVGFFGDKYGNKLVGAN